MVKSFDPNSVIDAKEVQPTNWKTVSSSVEHLIQNRCVDEVPTLQFIVGVLLSRIPQGKVSCHEENPLCN